MTNAVSEEFKLFGRYTPKTSTMNIKETLKGDEILKHFNRYNIGGKQC